jgi:hypothetical protein
MKNLNNIVNSNYGLTGDYGLITGDMSIGGSCLVDYNVVAPSIYPTSRFQCYGTSTLGSTFISVGTLYLSSGSSQGLVPQFKVESSSNDSALSLKNTSTGGNDWWIGSGGNSAGYGSGLYFYNGNLRMMIKNDGKIGINTHTPSATLEVAGGTIISGSTSYLKLPNLTTTQRDALTASNGMLIYNSTENRFEGYKNGSWVEISTQIIT